MEVDEMGWKETLQVKLGEKRKGKRVDHEAVQPS
jgi:hypothetical protein